MDARAKCPLGKRKLFVKSLAQLTRNVSTAVRNPAVLQKWLQYRWAVYSGNEPTLCIGSNIFKGFPNFNAYLGAWQYRPDRSEISFLSRNLRPAGTVIDVGANFGVLTILIGALSPSSTVYAFEPHPRTFDSLKRNVSDNRLAHRVHCIQSALSTSIGTVAFADGAAPATNRIVRGSDQSIEVPVTTIDTFCQARNLGTIDFLKIDVEGAELDVLSGARTYFENKSIRVGMIEICPGNLKHFGKSVADLREFFETHEYDLRWYGENGEVAATVSEELPEDFLGNAVFTPSARKVAA